ncbi:MAG: hypothetical protein ACYTFD_14515 [Planctomycetota bacterium]|jgi:hypothetical protein
MKALAIATLLALAAPQADAGDFRFEFGFRHKGKHFRVGIGRRRHHACQRVWVPGRFETVSHRVWVPGYRKRVWRPARFGHRARRHGHHVSYVVRRGRYRDVYVPGHWEVRREQVWRPGTYETNCHCR